jgi:hypothetical protein
LTTLTELFAAVSGFLDDLKLLLAAGLSRVSDALELEEQVAVLSAFPFFLSMFPDDLLERAAGLPGIPVVPIDTEVAFSAYALPGCASDLNSVVAAVSEVLDAPKELFISLCAFFDTFLILFPSLGAFSEFLRKPFAISSFCCCCDSGFSVTGSTGSVLKKKSLLLSSD